MRSLCRKSHLVWMLLAAGPVAAEVQVEAWYHLSDNAFPQDASGHQRHFGKPIAGYTHASPDAAGGPLGAADFVSMASLEFGREAISGYYYNGYTAPNDNVGTEAWVKAFGDGEATGSDPLGGWILSTGGLGGLNFGVERRAEGMVIVGGVVNLSYVGSPVPLEANRWTHIALVRDRGLTTLYVDGVACGPPSAVAPTVVPNDAVHLGVSRNAIGGFKGLIDEARIFTFAPGAFKPTDLLLRHRPAPGTVPQVEEVQVSSYQVKTWQSDVGLPHNTVTAIEQTSDGYLWVGTPGGLARFDGRRFMVFQPADTPALGSGRIRSLCQGRGGVLWITTQEGALVRHAGGGFTTVIPGERMAFVQAIEDGGGLLWLATASGDIGRWDGTRYTVVAHGDGPGAYELNPGKDGQPLVVGRDGIKRAEGKGLVAIPESGKMPPTGFLCAGAGGGQWFTAGNLTQLRRGDRVVATAGRPTPSGLKIHGALEDHLGRLWLATNKGVMRKDIQLGELALTAQDGLGNDEARVVFEDSGGGIWIGTDGGGLSRLNPPLVTTLGVTQGMPAGRISALCPGKDDTLWAGSEYAGLGQFRNITAQVTRGPGEALASIAALALDAEGRLFVGSPVTGLWLKGDKGFDRPPGFFEAETPVRSLFSDGGGRLWIGQCQTRGLLSWDHGALTRLDLPREVAACDVCALAEDREGGIWAGTDGQGLLRWQNGKWQRFSRSEGLHSEVIWSLRADDEGALWIGTLGGGLSRWKDGKIITCTTRDGLEDDTITHIEDDGRGHFWCGSHRGVFRVRKSDLNDFADGIRKQIRCVRYGIADGLPSLECSGGFQPAGCKTTDGRIWFPTLKGVAMINPSAIRPDSLAPPVQIDGITVDGAFRPLGHGSGPAFVSDTGQRRYRFHYASVDFTAPEALRFRTFLEGIDSDWVDAGHEDTADYSRLEAGHYVFNVQAAGRDGVWSQPGAVFSFDVRPQWWERPAVRALLLLMLMGGTGGGMWALTRARLRRRVATFEQQQSLEIERRRIAANIHDDLGASLTRIALLSDLALDGARIGGVGEEVEQIHQTANELTKAMDEVVWAVAPEHDTLESLANYLARVAQDLLRPAGLRCRLSIPTELPDIAVSGQVRHNLYLAVKETIHNAIRHAAATEVRLALELEPGSFSIIVMDNGKGFGPRSSESGRIVSGHGVGNLSKRMQEIGGRCDIVSTPGEGTEIRFHAPLRLPPPSMK